MLQDNNRAHTLAVSASKLSRGRGAQPERRSEKRHVALLRVALLHSGGDQDLCVVKNISASGLAARVYRDLPIDAQVEVEFRSGELLKGSVVWKQDRDIGIVFPQSIDVEAVLASSWLVETGRRRNLPRIELSCEGRLRRGNQVHDVRLQDISQGGARVLIDDPVDLGSVLLVLPDLPPLAGVVRWVADRLAGISFNECISFDTLASWIEGRRRGRKAGSVVGDTATAPTEQVSKALRRHLRA